VTPATTTMFGKTDPLPLVEQTKNYAKYRREADEDGIISEFTTVYIPNDELEGEPPEEITASFNEV